MTRLYIIEVKSVEPDGTHIRPIVARDRYETARESSDRPVLFTAEVLASHVAAAKLAHPDAASVTPRLFSDLAECTVVSDDAKDQHNIEIMISHHRVVRGQMLALTESLFPAGTRVAPLGCRSFSWRGTVRQLDKYARRDLPADLVWVDWDNGNKHSAPINEIEHVR